MGWVVFQVIAWLIMDHPLKQKRKTWKFSFSSIWMKWKVFGDCSLPNFWLCLVWRMSHLNLNIIKYNGRVFIKTRYIISCQERTTFLWHGISWEFLTIWYFTIVFSTRYLMIVFCHGCDRILWQYFSKVFCDGMFRW